MQLINRLVWLRKITLYGYLSTSLLLILSVSFTGAKTEIKSLIDEAAADSAFPLEEVFRISDEKASEKKADRENILISVSNVSYSIDIGREEHFLHPIVIFSFEAKNLSDQPISGFYMSFRNIRDGRQLPDYSLASKYIKIRGGCNPHEKMELTTGVPIEELGVNWGENELQEGAKLQVSIDGKSWMDAKKLRKSKSSR